MSDLESLFQTLGENARRASRKLGLCSVEQKTRALLSIADALEAATPDLIQANLADLELARAKGLSEAMIDRLRLDEKRVSAMAKGVREVAAQADPVGVTMAEWIRPNGLRISKVRVPIGVIGIIFESRPNVTSDAAVLCLKAGNACILRGGSESIHSNLAIASVLQKAITAAELPGDAVQLVPVTDRDAVRVMARSDKYIDVIVPRGGHQLIEAVVENARMPVIKHYHGVCHLYVDEAADLKMALEIAINGKCQRPGVCNSLETLLVHRSVAPQFLAQAAPVFAEQRVELRADDRAREWLGETSVPATEADWSTEYLDLILSVAVVDSLEAAVDHIEKYGSHHSDAIVTADAEAAEKFLAAVDSAAVYWNASTRFTDGGEFGFGAEIGISTDKLHARGPMGLEELTTYKYVVRGDGQIR